MNTNRVDQEVNDDFRERQRKAQERINQLDKDQLNTRPEREAFFNAVYAQAQGDAANVPWAELSPKPQLTGWLARNAAVKGRAIDVACGLGDHAEALVSAGFETTAFDNASDAIDWARRRFPQSAVRYRVADLFNMPEEWAGAFDLVWECYTQQAMPPETLAKSQPAIASLVRLGGVLLTYTRVRADGAEAEGPPWPLEHSSSQWFGRNGFERISQDEFSVEKNGRSIPHFFTQWQKTS